MIDDIPQTLLAEIANAIQAIRSMAKRPDSSMWLEVVAMIERQEMEVA